MSKQIGLLDDAEKVKKEGKQRHEKLEEKQKRRKTERKRKEKEFKRRYKHGSTTVCKKEGNFYFNGDIEHCGKEDIFHNARMMKQEMKKTGCRHGHMDYNSLPVFEKSFNWKDWNDTRRDLMEHDLYMFNEDDEIVKVDDIGYLVAIPCISVHLVESVDELSREELIERCSHFNCDEMIVQKDIAHIEKRTK